MTPCRTEILTRPEQWAKLAPEWADLWARCPDATAFQSAAWLLPWWRHFGQGPLRVVAAWSAPGRLAALAPLFAWDEPTGRKLLPVGIGNTDYLDPLVDPAEDAGAGAVRALFAGLAECAADGEVAEWPELRPGSALLVEPFAAAPGWESEVAGQESCPVLGLPGSVGELAGVLPASMGQNLRYYRHRAARRGGWEVTAVADGDDDGRTEALEQLFRLHGRRWRGRGLPGVLEDEVVRRFHREAAPALAAAGRLRLFVGRLAGEVRAVFYGFADRRRTCYYLGGFDPESAPLSPGTLLVGHAVERAVCDGHGEFHFLRGREPYKYHWGAVDRLNAVRRCRRRGSPPTSGSGPGPGCDPGPAPR